MPTPFPDRLAAVQADDRIRAVADTARDAFVEQDGNLVIIGWNSHAERLFGWPAADAIGMPSHVLVPERNRDRHVRSLRALVETAHAGPITHPLTAVHRDGHEFKVDSTVSFTLRHGTPCVVSFVHERLEPARVEARLHEAERQYRDLIDRLEDGYFEVDLKGVFTFVNDAYCRLTGRAARELLGVSFKQLFHDAERVKAIQDAYARIYKTGEALKGFEHTVTRKDGTKRFVEDTVTLKRDANGQPIGFIGIRRDCTERRLAADTLRLSEERYRAILERIEDGYFEIDLSRKGRYHYVNDAFCEIAGHSREELIGHSYTEFFDPETCQLLYNNYHQVYLTGQSLKALEYALIAKDGTQKFVEESVSLRKDASGAIQIAPDMSGYLLFLDDFRQD